MPYDGLMSKGSNVAFGAREDLAMAFAGADMDISVPGEKFVVTCRSRVTACHLAMDLAESTAGRGLGSGGCDSWWPWRPIDTSQWFSSPAT